MMDPKEMKVLAIIPARGDSKGIPRKNLRLLAGKPLIAHAIERARQSKSISRIVLQSLNVTETVIYRSLELGIE